MWRLERKGNMTEYLLVRYPVLFLMGIGSARRMSWKGALQAFVVGFRLGPSNYN